MEKEQQVTGGESVAEGVEARPGGPAAEASASGLGVKLLRVAWMAILLGFAMEALLLLVATGFFGDLPGLRPLVRRRLLGADLAHIGVHRGRNSCHTPPVGCFREG